MRNTILKEKNKVLDIKDNGYLIEVINNKKNVQKMNFVQVILNYFSIKKSA